ncbi:Crp/Fnr family transcriptional regulator [uncultured Sphingomonas sp.]|uniref:Crp/Fnr family transcriptional regulator n=1 Tax=uncultured Sphingomonas sp. TaxID=158754 RepID=UPI0035CBE089
MANRFVEKLCRFVQLSPEEMAALEEATARPRPFGPHRDLIREGDRPGPVLVMLEGWALRYKVLPGGGRQIVAFLMPGDACDLHVNLLAEMDHSIQTITNAQVATIPGEIMEKMMAQPGIARAMYISQLVDEGTLRAWIVSMGRRSSVERIAHLLLELYRRAADVGLAAGDTMALPLSQAVLADAVGMTSVHVNRMLQELRRSGAVTLQRGVLNICNPAALTRLAGFDENYLHRSRRSVFS